MSRAQGPDGDPRQSLYLLALLDQPPIDPAPAKFPALISYLLQAVGLPDRSLPLGLGLETAAPVKADAPVTEFQLYGQPSALPSKAKLATAPIAHLNGCRVELFGTTFGTTIPGLEVPVDRVWEIPLERDDGQVFTLNLLAWRQRAYLGSSDMYAELRWHPGLKSDHVRFGGLEQDHSALDLRKLDEAISLLRRIPHKWPGTKPTERERNVKKLAAAMVKIASRGSIPVERVTWAAIAEELVVDTSTVYYYRKLAPSARPEITQDEVIEMARILHGSSGDKLEQV